MAYDKYHDRGRTLKIEFECQRCKKTILENLSDVVKRSDDTYDRITWLKTPKGWYDRGGYLPLLCDKCNEDLNAFLTEKVIRE